MSSLLHAEGELYTHSASVAIASQLRLPRWSLSSSQNFCCHIWGMGISVRGGTAVGGALSLSSLQSKANKGSFGLFLVSVPSAFASTNGVAVLHLSMASLDLSVVVVVVVGWMGGEPASEVACTQYLVLVFSCLHAKTSSVSLHSVIGSSSFAFLLFSSSSSRRRCSASRWLRLRSLASSLARWASFCHQEGRSGFAGA